MTFKNGYHNYSRITDRKGKVIYEGNSPRKANRIWASMLIASGVVPPEKDRRRYQIFGIPSKNPI